MGSLLPRFVTPADVDAIRARVDAVVRTLDAQAPSCLGPAQLAAWQAFRAGWSVFLAVPSSWLHTAAQMDQSEAYEQQVANWQREFQAAGCASTAPILNPESSTAWAGVLTILGAAAFVGGVAWVVREVRR